MKYNPLTIKDKTLFDRFLSARRRELSAYSFANIFIWRKLFNIFWAVIDNNLCVFFQDRIGTFLYLPPLADVPRKDALKRCFDIMDGFNPNKDISRIENVEEQDVEFYRRLGYECVYRDREYVYESSRLAQLKGNPFKSKRAAFNYFVKRQRFDYGRFSFSHKNNCLKLLKNWAEFRKRKSTDPVYIKMLEDSSVCQRVALANHKKLGLTGRIIKINNRLKAYTFGYRLNEDTFCVLFEITDLSVKGISEFIFRKFAGEAGHCRYVNVMDDGGLENLRRVKLSYRPVRFIPAYIVKRRFSG